MSGLWRIMKSFTLWHESCVHFPNIVVVMHCWYEWKTVEKWEQYTATGKTKMFAYRPLSSPSPWVGKEWGRDFSPFAEVIQMRSSQELMILHFWCVLLAFQTYFHMAKYNRKQIEKVHSYKSLFTPNALLIVKKKLYTLSRRAPPFFEKVDASCAFQLSKPSTSTELPWQPSKLFRLAPHQKYVSWRN